MFDNIRKQLELQTLGQSKKFKITKQEYDEFYKSFLFEILKGDKTLGQFFCEKFDEKNYILMSVSNQTAKDHIKKFYVE